MSDLPRDLRIKAGMIMMCERIPFGSDAALMELAANEIEQLQQRNAELAAQIEKLRVAATIVLNARDEDGITTSGLLKKFNELSEALSFLPHEYLAKHDREVAERAGRDGYMQCAKDFGLDAKGTYVNGWAAYQLADKYANKIKSGEVAL